MGMGARHCKAKESANKITFALLFIIAAYRRKDDERAHFIPEVRHSEPLIFAERKKKLP